MSAPFTSPRQRPARHLLAPALVALALLPPAWGATVQTLHPVWLRAAPDEVARLLVRLPADTRLEQLGERFGPWIQVQPANGRPGWLRALDVQGARILPPTPMTPTVSKVPAPVVQAVAAPVPPVPQTAEQRLAQAWTYGVDADTARRFAERIGLSEASPNANAEVAAEAATQAPLGQALAESVLKDHALSTDVALQTYVNLLGRWLSLSSEQPDLHWTFAVLDDADARVWAAPGGYVFVTHGLVQRLQSEAELAAVLAHALVLIDEPDLWSPLLAASQVGGMAAAQQLYLQPEFGAPAQLGADRSAALLLSRCGLPAHAMLDAIRHADTASAAPSVPGVPAAEIPAPTESTLHRWLNRLLGRSTTTPLQTPPQPQATSPVVSAGVHPTAERLARLQAFLDQRNEADTSAPSPASSPTLSERLQQLDRTAVASDGSAAPATGP